MGRLGRQNSLVRLIGLPGVPVPGESTVRRELVPRREIAHDADEDGFRVWLNRATGLAVDDRGRGRRQRTWSERHWYLIAPDRVESVRPVSEHDVVSLAASVPRTDNDFGKDPAVRDAVLG
jgi:hypothetical protein